MTFEFQTELPSLETVPEKYRSLYSQEGEGPAKLDPELARRITKIGDMDGALNKERRKVGERERKLDAWRALGESPEAVGAKIQELEETIAKGGDAAASFEKLKQDMEAGKAKDLAAKDQEVAKMRQAVERYLVDAEATKAITAASGSAKLLLPHVQRSTKVVEENGAYVVRVVDHEGHPRGDGQGGYLTIPGLVKEMQQSDDFAMAFKAPATSGGGTPTNGAGDRGGSAVTTVFADDQAAINANHQKIAKGEIQVVQR